MGWPLVYAKTRCVSYASWTLATSPTRYRRDDAPHGLIVPLDDPPAVVVLPSKRFATVGTSCMSPRISRFVSRSGSIHDAARRAHVVIGDRVDDVGERESRRLQLLWVDVDLNRGRHVAVLLHVRDARDLLDARARRFRYDRRELAQREGRRRCAQRNDDRFARIVNRNLRGRQIVGQLMQRVLYAPLHLNEIGVLIRRQEKTATIEAWPG